MHSCTIVKKITLTEGQLVNAMLFCNQLLALPPHTQAPTLETRHDAIRWELNLDKHAVTAHRETQKLFSSATRGLRNFMQTSWRQAVVLVLILWGKQKHNCFLLNYITQ